MIKSEYGIVEVKGLGADLVADFCSIAWALLETGVYKDKEELIKDLEDGFKTMEDLERVIDVKPNEEVNSLFDELDKLLKKYQK